MAQQLDDRLSEVVRQRNELGTILSSMEEGVLAIDSELRVISLNRSAATLLQLDPALTIDRTIEQAITDPELRRYISQPLETGKGVQGEVKLLRPVAEDEQTPPWASSDDTADSGVEDASADSSTRSRTSACSTTR